MALNGSVPAWESYADWYRRGAYAPFVTEARLPANAPIQLLRVRQPAGHFPDLATPDLSLALPVQSFSKAQCDFGAGRFSQPGYAGQFALAPNDAACDYLIDSPHELLPLTLPGTFARSNLDCVSSQRRDDRAQSQAAMNCYAVSESVLRRLSAKLPFAFTTNKSWK